MIVHFGILSLIFVSATNTVLGCDPQCLVYVAGTRINTLELKTERTLAVHTQSVQPVAVDGDIARERIYWSDYSKRSIMRAFFNGTGVETIVFNCGKTGGLAINWLSDHLYWTNLKHKRIGVSRLDGSHRSFIIKDLDQPLGLAIDPEERSIFWSDIGKVPKIEKATLAGGYRKVLVSKDILSPNALVVDYNSNPKLLYWTDVLEYAVQSIELDGTNRKKITKLDKVNVQHPFGITLNNENLYLTDWKTGSINVIERKTGNFKEALKTSVSGKIKKIMGIAMLDKSRQPQGLNPCNNNGCSHLCLEDRNGPKCFCPDGQHLNPDVKTCSKLKAFLLIADSYLSLICTITLDSTTQIVQPVIYRSKHSIEQPVAVDFDKDEDKIYWSDIGRKTITRAFLNGSGFEVFRNVEKVEGLAIDSFSRKIYWTDVVKNTIESCRLDGTSHMVLIDSSYLTWPRGICARPIDSFIYWTERGREPRIGRVGMDGSSKKTLINLRTSASPNSLFLHYSKYTLYYTDAASHEIVSYDLTTKDTKILNKQTIGFYRLNEFIDQPFGLAMDHEYLYWTDWTKKSVYRANRESGEEFKKLVEFLEKPTGITAISFGQKSGSSSPAISCPNDYDMYNKNRFTFKTFSVKLATVEVRFSEIPTVECSPSEISLNDYGDHKIVCTANTIDGHSDSCSYRINVKDHLCSRLPPPMNGHVKCTTRCSVKCDEDFVLAKSMTANMACYGARWRPKYNKKINLFSVCLAKRSPTRLEITSKIAFQKVCGELNEKETILEFQDRLKEILHNGEKAKHILVIFETGNVSITCSHQKYWLTTNAQNVVEIRFTLFLDSLMNQVDSGFTNPEKTVQETKNILFESVKDGSFTLTVDREKIQAFANSFVGHESAICRSLEIEKSYFCLKCSFGMYFNKTTQDCEPCPMGYYQDKEGQTSCHECPIGTSTVVMGTEASLGCYGRQEILANISVDVIQIDPTKLKNAVADFVNYHCQVNKCPIESNKNTESDGSIDNVFIILPSDVVIPRGYPIKSKQGYLYVACFVVVSFKNGQPEFFPRKELHEIFNKNHPKLEKKLGGQVVVNPSATQAKNDTGSNSSTLIIIIIIIGSILGILVLMIIVGFVWKRRAKNKEHAEAVEVMPLQVRNDRREIAAQPVQEEDALTYMAPIY